jgi:hypothetical protein
MDETKKFLDGYRTVFPRFVFLLTDDKKQSLINLNQVRTIEKISDQHVQLQFAPDHTINVHGQNAIDLVEYCMTHAVQADGQPLPAVSPDSASEK